jgi:hypothetical protein
VLEIWFDTAGSAVPLFLQWRDVAAFFIWGPGLHQDWDCVIISAVSDLQGDISLVARDFARDAYFVPASLKRVLVYLYFLLS